MFIYLQSKHSPLNQEEKNTDKNLKVSHQTLKRLPDYLHYLQKAEKNGIYNISAPKMGSDLQADPTQIVKDLAVTGVKGKPRVGYNVVELISTIEHYLGFNRDNEAFLVGAGKLGQALLSYQELQGFGIKIIAAFDVDKNKINKPYGTINILPFDKMGELASRLGVSIGIITTPREAAQQAADAMIKSGIKAIWNFAPIKLVLPPNIIVQNTSMYANVAVLLKRYYDSIDEE